MTELFCQYTIIIITLYATLITLWFHIVTTFVIIIIIIELLQPSWKTGTIQYNVYLYH